MGALAILGPGLAAGLAAALCYGLGSVFQAAGARHATTSTGLDPRLLVRLLGRGPYVFGLALDGIGFAANVVALHWLPLFLVQSLIAGSVGITAIGAVVVFHVRLSRRSVVALAGLLLGLGLLAAVAKPGPALALPRGGEWALVGCAVLLAGLAIVAGRTAGQAGQWMLAAVAGAAFGGVGVAARGLVVPHPVWHLLIEPASWALVGFGLLGTLAFATALQRGSVTVASGVMFAVETVLPAGVGIAWLGDTTVPGLGVPLAVIGFVLTLAGAIGLARYSEPGAVAA